MKLVFAAHESVARYRACEDLCASARSRRLIRSQRRRSRQQPMGIRGYQCRELGPCRSRRHRHLRLPGLCRWLLQRSPGPRQSGNRRPAQVRTGDRKCHSRHDDPVPQEERRPGPAGGTPMGITQAGTMPTSESDPVPGEPSGDREAVRDEAGEPYWVADLRHAALRDAWRGGSGGWAPVPYSSHIFRRCRPDTSGGRGRTAGQSVTVRFRPTRETGRNGLQACTPVRFRSPPRYRRRGQGHSSECPCLTSGPLQSLLFRGLRVLAAPRAQCEGCRERLIQALGDVRVALREEVGFATPPVPVGARRSGRRWRRRPWRSTRGDSPLPR